MLLYSWRYTLFVFSGLFHQIIGQSGTDLNFWTLNYPPSDPADYTKQVADQVGLKTLLELTETLDVVIFVNFWNLN